MKKVWLQQTIDLGLKYAVNVKKLHSILKLWCVVLLSSFPYQLCGLFARKSCDVFLLSLLFSESYSPLLFSERKELHETVVLQARNLVQSRIVLGKQQPSWRQAVDMNFRPAVSPPMCPTSIMGPQNLPFWTRHLCFHSLKCATLHFFNQSQRHKIENACIVGINVFNVVTLS